jgi:hypothetical protein
MWESLHYLIKRKNTKGEGMLTRSDEKENTKDEGKFSLSEIMEK